MQLENLILAKLVSHEEAQTYLVFGCTEVGYNWLTRMVNDTFMDYCSPLELSTEVLAYSEGRRSIIREIKMCIDNVTKQLQEVEHV